ncbi:adenylate kinase [Candidatus Woesearchaeota archaeon]|nr:adenylate kinase [Candidatus Woesearchaeota archaeon]
MDEKNKENNIVVLGAQGSGKGTQAERLERKFHIPHISTGDVFREMRTQDTELGRKVKDLIDKGIFVPDEITNQIVAERLKKDDAKPGFILDGYPRNISQAENLDRLRPIKHCILIEVGDDKSIERIGARRICSKCKANYNIIYLKPKVEGVCDSCGGELIMRDDDKPEAVKLRLSKYHSETAPLISFYEKKGVLLRINGEQMIEKVFLDIMKKLG